MDRFDHRLIAPLPAFTLIESQAQRLRDEHNLHPYTASEIEFYLHGSAANSAIEAAYAQIKSACDGAGIEIAHIGPEKGFEQHEISIKPSADAVKIARDTIEIKRIIDTAAAAYSMKADFSAKPSPDQPGSGLHIHVHLADSSGKNLYYKDDERISDELKYSIGGLLKWMPDSLAVFAPYAQSYNRFTAGGNTPVTVSWGANNRTVAVRLPDAAHDRKHIEHRVAGADADAGRVIAVILAAMHYGITHKNDPGAQIYGDAALPVYNLPKFHASLEDAKASLQNSKVISGYFNVADLL